MKRGFARSRMGADETRGIMTKEILPNDNGGRAGPGRSASAGRCRARRRPRSRRARLSQSSRNGGGRSGRPGQARLLRRLQKGDRDLRGPVRQAGDETKRSSIPFLDALLLKVSPGARGGHPVPCRLTWKAPRIIADGRVRCGPFPGARSKPRNALSAADAGDPCRT